MNLVRSRSYGQVTPPAGARVDWSHPLSRGLVAAVVVGGAVRPVDLVAQLGPTGIGGTARSPRGIYNAANSSGNWVEYAYPRIGRPGATGSITIVASGVWNGAALGYGGMATYTDTSGGFAGQVAVQATDSTNLGGWFNADYVAGAIPVSGQPFIRAASYDLATTTRRIRSVTNGAVVGNTASVSALTLITANPKLRVAAARTDTYDFPGTVEWVYLYDRALIDGELQWLSVEPYAFVAPPGPKVLYFGFGTASTTHTASLTITGAGAAAFTATRAVSASASIAGAGAVAATGLRAASASVTITGSGALSFGGYRTVAATLAILGNGTLAFTGSGGGLDTNPITLTLKERTHTLTLLADGHTLTGRGRGHTATGRENR